ncbi:MAG: hypothetical protein COA88_16045 [Kordia sp.]|nr:MAG: hypothetical protein COA88_16045 [Kordia sp.]
MKRNFTLLVLLIALISSLSYGQKDTKHTYSSQQIEKFNLPPGAKLMGKNYEYVDYSYKLNTTYSNELVSKNYLFKFTVEEFNILKNKNKEAYLYYQNANNYFIRLSDKVKKAFTVNELWYIYMYDQKLKKHLTLIK